MPQTPIVWVRSGTCSRPLCGDLQAPSCILRDPSFAAHRWAMAEVKICGLTTVEDALRCIEAGADVIGLNFWPRSPRSTDVATAKAIVAALGDRVEVVGVFVDFDVAQTRGRPLAEAETGPAIR